jgi:hypothetical protein
MFSSSLRVVDDKKAFRDMHTYQLLRQLLYCTLLVGVFYAISKIAPRRWSDLWQWFERGCAHWQNAKP